MTDGEALLRAILEVPDDDAPRLVYADWLQENGLGRHADFIRRGVRKPGIEFVDNVPHRISSRGAGKFLPHW